MKKSLRKMTLSKETLRTLGSTLEQARGGYPVSTATNCNACWTYETCATLSCDTGCWTFCFC